MIELLTYKEYVENARKNEQWKSYASRWAYHEKAIEIIRSLGIGKAKRVLEIGVFGAGLVKGSDRMDKPETKWIIAGERITLKHDARLTPWPIPSGEYELLSSLRVWHHLAPYQEAAFREARRVARYVLIACPEKEAVGIGIPRKTFISWGGEPIIEHDFQAWGRLYLFAGEWDVTKI